MDDHVSATLPEIKENSKSRSITHRKKPSKKTKGRDGAGAKTTKKTQEDPYEHHQFFVNNKASNSIMKLLKNSYANPSAVTSQERIRHASEFKSHHHHHHGNVKDMMNIGGEKCVEKNYYKCASTELISGVSSHNHSSHNDSSSKMREVPSVEIPGLRYSNQIGFKEGLLFPIAKKTNPPLYRRKSSQNE